MKLICSKSNLLNGVNIVSKAVPSKTTMSILECILIDATKGQITLTANDMELGIETVIEGEIIEKGIIALDAKIFLEMVRKLPDNDVTIETDSSYKTIITCEKATFNIIGKSGEDFSYLPQIERSDSILLSQFTLKEVIRQTIFSIADNFTNKILTGELFEINGNLLKVVSSDGLRISLRRIELKNTYPDKKVIVPGKTLNEISKILSGDADKDRDRAGTLHTVVLLIYRQTADQAGGTRTGIKPRRFQDKFLIYARFLGSPFRCVFLYACPQFLKAVGPFLHKGMVVKLFLNDNMDHSQCESSIAVRTHLQPKVCLGCGFRKERVHTDEHRTALAGVHNIAGTHAPCHGRVDAPA